MVHAVCKAVEEMMIPFPLVGSVSILALV